MWPSTVLKPRYLSVTMQSLMLSHAARDKKMDGEQGWRGG